MRYGSWVIIVLLLLGISSLSTQVSEAQIGGTCTALVEQALDSIGENCGGLGRNAACYGFNNVAATFNDVQPPEFFTQPADFADLLDIQTLNTAALNVDTSEWGIAVLNVQADLPDALPGQAVSFLLFGDVALENAVDPTAAAAPVAPISVTTMGETLMRTRPTGIANTSASIPADTNLSADRISDDGAWLRVVYNELAGWIAADSVRADDDLSTLPTPQTAPYTPMQAVRLETALTGLNCEAAPPSLLVVQGPKEITVNLTVNGAELNIGSTIALWASGTPPTMQLAVIDGGVYLADGTYIPAGYIAEVQLDESGNVIGAWSTPRPLTLEEWLLFEPLEGVPPELLNYAIDVPSELIASLQPTPVPTVPPPPPPPVNNPPPPPQVIQVDCSPLRATSPTDGLAFGAVTFFWDGIANSAVTGYRVNLYRDGALVGSYSAPLGNTNVSGDLSSVPIGGAYTWEVQALVNGVAVCTANANVSMARAFPPNDDPPPQPQDVTSEAPICGNEICEEGENAETCYSDCFVYTPPEPTCGNEICEEGEDAETCFADCGTFSPSSCGDEFCDAEGGENSETCSLDCGREPSCGNEICEPFENYETCSLDCPFEPEPFCGDGICEPRLGENAETCPADCLSNTQ